MKTKKCSIFNYIPNCTPSIINDDTHFEKWFHKYEHDLRKMFISTLNIIKNKDYTDVTVDLDTEKNFNIFINFVYNASSKYI